MYRSYIRRIPCQVFRRLRALYPSSTAEPAEALDSGATEDGGMEQALADYAAAEDALRAFTDQNFGRLCAICARWTLLQGKTNGGAEWRLRSWVTNCCNANHAVESMSEDSLSGIVASRAEGREWWRRIKRANAAPCVALTDEGCALTRGRPELCNRYFCEAVRDYLWHIGGARDGARLASHLDDTQRRWTRLYAVYGRAIAAGRGGARVDAKRVRREAGVEPFLRLLERFDRAVGAVSRPVSPAVVTDQLFKVSGDKAVYEPFFAREVEAISGSIRREE